jgi:hypothetical protein
MADSLCPGEIVQASTTQFTAQCIDVPRPETVGTLPEPPPFGAFVRVGGRGSVAVVVDVDPFERPRTLPVSGDDAATLYAVVFHAETGALDAGRPLTALGLAEDELLREQPQLYELLATRFTAALIGYDDSAGTFVPYLPPRPARPHARVTLCGDDDIRRLTGGRLEWLRGVLAGDRVPSGIGDELIGAVLRRAARAQGAAAEAFLLRAGQEVARILAGDYERLRAIVARLV